MLNKNQSEEVKTGLLQLGLTENEIAVYLATMEASGISIPALAKKTGISRGTVYDIVEKLKAQGFIIETRKGKRRQFVAENPMARLYAILDQKHADLEKSKNAVERALPSLKVLDVQQENKPQIKFFEGAAGINKVYDEYILKNPEVINCGSYETATRVISFQDEMDYFQDIAKQKISYRMILEDTPLNRKFAEAGKEVSRSKFLPAGVKTSADVIVFGPLVALVSYDKANVTLIENESIAQAIKMYLDFMWERL